MTEVTGGELVVRMLAQAGVPRVFGLHGAHLEPLFQACLDHGIDLIDTRHEAAAGHAAEGHARVTRMLGVALATAGPGFTNVLTSVANALLDRTPVLYLAGEAPLAAAETNTLQGGIDQLAVARPLTKWAHRVTSIEHLPRLVAEAIRIATAAPAGPVLLCLPVDVLMAKIDDTLPWYPTCLDADTPALPPAERVTAAIELLAAARRPALLAGTGLWQAHGEAALQRFVAASGIPVYTDYPAHGMLPSDHRLHGGTYHKLSELPAAQRPDVILALGVRFGLFTLGRSETLLPHTTRIIQVDTEPKELGLIRDPALTIRADCNEFLGALLRTANGRPWPDWSSWQQAIATATVTRRARLESEARVMAGVVHPYHAVRGIVEAISEDTIVVADGAECYHWLNEVIQQRRPGGYQAHGMLGAMGLGMGLALGVKAAQPQCPVLCLIGDGAIGFSIAEFDTMVRHGLPIVVVVCNNRGWNACRHLQEMTAGPERLIGTRLENARYDEVAAGFGCHVATVRDRAELAPALRAAFASGRPACINVLIDPVPFPPELLLVSL
ncbi:MAG: thiamine pyrophosphate-binding protein [Gammaproteobacteria bacterium]|nr:thiamine pyrophosphate-binding protein [Gammaproteobacteria bacterium]